MIISFLVGIIVGAIVMFIAIRKGYVKASKKQRIPDDVEIG